MVLASFRRMHLILGGLRMNLFHTTHSENEEKRKMRIIKSPPPSIVHTHFESELELSYCGQLKRLDLRPRKNVYQLTAVPCSFFSQRKIISLEGLKARSTPVLTGEQHKGTRWKKYINQGNAIFTDIFLQNSYGEPRVPTMREGRVVRGISVVYVCSICREYWGKTLKTLQYKVNESFFFLNRYFNDSTRTEMRWVYRNTPSDFIWKISKSFKITFENLIQLIPKHGIILKSITFYGIMCSLWTQSTLLHSFH